MKRVILLLLIQSFKPSFGQLPLNFGTSWRYYINPTTPQVPPLSGVYDWKSPYYSTSGVGWVNTTNLAPLGYASLGGAYSGTAFGTSLYNPSGNMPNGSGHYPNTIYYKASVTDATIPSYSSFNLELKADDGVVIYFNGAEVYRARMSGSIGSPVNHNDNASGCIGGSGCVASIPDLGPINILASSFPLNPTDPNKISISVEIHQYTSTAGIPAGYSNSSDSFFDLKLTSGTIGPLTSAITRGPYLQIPTPSSMQVRWRTNVSEVGSVKYSNISDSGPWTTATEGGTTFEHSLTLSSLSPNTKYWYSVGNTSTIHESGSNNFFSTPPATPVNTRPTNIWATGDCGADVAYATPAEVKQLLVKTNFLNYINTNGIDLDLWLLLGDNAYESGKDSEYQNTFFNVYQGDRIMKQAPIMPAPGNHDYYAQNTFTKDQLRVNKANDYYSIFSMPTAGQAGGVASGNKGHYSYNYNNVHIISLDSYGFYGVGDKKLYENVSPNPSTPSVNPQIEWLRQDLNATALNSNIKWTILYWHHSPYTKGNGHDSDNDPTTGPGPDEAILEGIRQNLVPLLDQYKIDLVLCGHSHSYERTKLLKGHYGDSGVFGSDELAQSYPSYSNHNSLGSYSSTSCPYIKHSSSPQNEGIIYAISGSAGWVKDQSSTVPSIHPAMKYRNLSEGGSMLIQILGNKLEAKWIDEAGLVADRFTILKDINNGIPIVNTIHQNELPTESPILQKIQTPVWPDVLQFTLTNPSGITSAPFGAGVINVPTPDIGALYTIKDQFGCLSQTYRFTFNGSCWGNVTINNTFYPTATPEVISSSGTISSTSLIKNLANVSFISKVHNNLVTTGVGVLFQAELGAIFNNTINTSIACPPSGM